MSDFWQNRIVESGAASPEELAKGMNPLNWRGHPEAQRDALEEALDSIGFLQRVLVNRSSGRVIDGHLRIELAVLKGQPLIPVDYVELSDDEEALALATLDAITEQAEPIADKLAALLERTRHLTADKPGLAGMLEQLRLRAGANGNGKTPPEDNPPIDKAGDLQKVWKTAQGQVWQLGNHRLIVGDCTDRQTVESVMSGERARLVVTDPPYGVSYADKNKFLNAIGRANRIETPIENDHATKEKTQAMWKAAFSQMSAVMDAGAVVYCFSPQASNSIRVALVESLIASELEPKQDIIWLKNNHVLGRVDYAYKHEPILYAWKEGGHKFYGDFQTSILEYPKPQISDLHPTQKPVALIERLISNSSLPDEVVYDPFTGSGTVIIACENLGRKCRAIELDPGYCAVTLQRWADLTQQQPRLVSG